MPSSTIKLRMRKTYTFPDTSAIVTEGLRKIFDDLHRTLRQALRDVYDDLDILRKRLTKTVTADYTASKNDQIIIADTSSGNITIALPAAATVTGKRFCIKHIAASNTTTIDPNGSETVDGATTLALSTRWDFRWVVSDGTQYLVVGS